MRITVLIAVKDYGRYLEKAIESALKQTLLPSCICVVDDGSTDNTWDIAKGFAEKNQREEQSAPSALGDIAIKVGSINKVDIIAVKLPKSVGPSEARNIAIGMTNKNTDVYAILDADDEMLPNKLEFCIRPFVNQNIGVVYANYYNINSATGVRILEVKEPFDIFRLHKECIVHSGSLIRKDALLKVQDEFGFYDRTMRTCEDWDLWIRLSKVCAFYHIAEALTNVLVHPNNSTNSVPNEVWQQNWNRIAQKNGG